MTRLSPTLALAGFLVAGLLLVALPASSATVFDFDDFPDFVAVPDLNAVATTAYGCDGADSCTYNDVEAFRSSGTGISLTTERDDIGIRVTRDRRIPGDLLSGAGHLGLAGPAADKFLEPGDTLTSDNGPYVVSFSTGLSFAQVELTGGILVDVDAPLGIASDPAAHEFFLTAFADEDGLGNVVASATAPRSQVESGDVAILAVSVPAGGAFRSIVFSQRPLGTPGVEGNGHVFADDITVVSVPEPSAWAMYILGLGLVRLASFASRCRASRISY